MLTQHISGVNGKWTDFFTETIPDAVDVVGEGFEDAGDAISDGFHTVIDGIETAVEVVDDGFDQFGNVIKKIIIPMIADTAEKAGAFLNAFVMGGPNAPAVCTANGVVMIVSIVACIGLTIFFPPAGIACDIATTVAGVALQIECEKAKLKKQQEEQAALDAENQRLIDEAVAKENELIAAMDAQAQRDAEVYVAFIPVQMELDNAQAAADAIVAAAWMASMGPAQVVASELPGGFQWVKSAPSVYADAEK